MTRREELEALAGRVEALTGACRETDADIMSPIGWLRDGYVRAIEHGKERPYFWHSTDEKLPTIYAARFTESIDHALGLAPVLAFWRLGHDGEGADPSLFKAHILSWADGTKASQRNSIAIAATPALALTAAALRAIAAQEQPA